MSILLPNSSTWIGQHDRFAGMRPPFSPTTRNIFRRGIQLAQPHRGEGIDFTSCRRVVTMTEQGPLRAPTAEASANARSGSRPPRPTGELLGSSDDMREVHDLIRRVADTDVTVLIRGESGTGKELVARAIHAASP